MFTRSQSKQDVPNAGRYSTSLGVYNNQPMYQTVLAPIVPRENIDPPSKNVYDKNMVRTDHKARSLRSFWENTQP